MVPLSSLPCDLCGFLYIYIERERENRSVWGETERGREKYIERGGGRKRRVKRGMCALPVCVCIWGCARWSREEEVEEEEWVETVED